MAETQVLQLYLVPPDLQLERPPRTLVAFACVMLIPGDRRWIRLTGRRGYLAFFEVERSGF